MRARSAAAPWASIAGWAALSADTSACGAATGNARLARAMASAGRSRIGGVLGDRHERAEESAVAVGGQVGQVRPTLAAQLVVECLGLVDQVVGNVSEVNPGPGHHAVAAGRDQLAVAFGCGQVAVPADDSAVHDRRCD